MRNDDCWMVRRLPPEGGGNLVGTEIIVRRHAALGDAISASVIANRLVEKGFSVVYQTHPHCAALLKYVPGLKRVEPTNGYAHIDLDGAYETHPNRRERHFNQMWFERAQRLAKPLSIDLGGPLNARPKLVLSPEQLAVARSRYADWPRPVVLFCPKSQYYNVRSVPDRIWEEAAGLINGTCGWLGLQPAPNGIRDLQIRTIDSLVQAIAGADLLVSVDTGPMHIAAALGVRTLALGQSSDPVLHLTDQQDWQVIYPGGLDCLNCQQNKCPKDLYFPPCQNFDPVKIAEFANRMAPSAKTSALIPTFYADADKLSKCLSNVAHQVDEVVVCVAADGKVPGIKLPRNTRVVRSPKAELGFGKNVNHGFRHTTGDWVLVLNDDCYLNGDCVEQLKSLRGPDVGMIAHLLRFPDGRIYFAGRTRQPGIRGFPHLNYLGHLPSVTSVAEMEALSATSVLVNRKAYYNIGGFDERFVMYAEDDDISMRMRQAGYRLLYHPTALGIHEGSVTSKKVGDMSGWIRESGKLMEQLWGWYYDKNRNRIPGIFT